MQARQNLSNGLPYDSATKLDDTQPAPYLHFTVPQAADVKAMNTPHGASASAGPQMTAIRPPSSTGTVAAPFYPHQHQHQRNILPRPNINPAQQPYQHTTLSVSDGSRLISMGRPQNTNQPPMFTLVVNNGQLPTAPAAAPASLNQSMHPQTAYAYPPGQADFAAAGFQSPFYYTPNNGTYMVAPNSALYQTQSGWTAAPAQATAATLQAYPTTSTIYNMPAGAQAIVQQPPPMVPGAHPIPVQTSVPAPVTKRDRHPLQIIDPNTNKDVLQEIEREKEEHQPSSQPGGIPGLGAGAPTGTVYYTPGAQPPYSASTAGPPPSYPLHAGQGQPQAGPHQHYPSSKHGSTSNLMTDDGQQQHVTPSTNVNNNNNANIHHHHPPPPHFANNSNVNINNNNNANTNISSNSNLKTDSSSNMAPGASSTQANNNNTTAAGSRGQTPHSRSLTPTDAQQQRQQQQKAGQRPGAASPGPPGKGAHPVEVSEQEKGAVYSEFALNIALAAAVPPSTAGAAATTTSVTATAGGGPPSKVYQQQAPPAPISGPIVFHQPPPPTHKTGSFPQTFYPQQQQPHFAPQIPGGPPAGGSIVVEFDATDVTMTSSTAAKPPPAPVTGATRGASQPSTHWAASHQILDIQRSASGGALVETKKGPAPAPAPVQSGDENVTGYSFGFFDDSGLSGGSPSSAATASETPAGAPRVGGGPGAPGGLSAPDRTPPRSVSSSSVSPEKLAKEKTPEMVPEDETDASMTIKADRETALTSTPVKTDARSSATKETAPFAVEEVTTSAIVSTSEREMPATVVIETTNADSMSASFTVPRPPAQADSSLEEGELKDISCVSDSAPEGPSASQSQSGSVTPTPPTSAQGPPSGSVSGAGGRLSNDIESIVNELRSKKLPEAWFYDNQDGARLYTRDYICAVSKLPICSEQPTLNEKTRGDLPDVLCVSKRKITGSDHTARLRSSAGLADRGPPAGMAFQFQAPWQQMSSSTLPKMKYSGRGSSGGMARGPSQGGGASGGGQQQQGGGKAKGGQPPLIIPRPSLNAEVQLKRAENAWKPMRKLDDGKDPEQIKTEELYRKVKSILNKITPQYFDELCGDFLDLEAQMDTEERTLGVIDILFNKVCDEPSFCEIYGQLCETLKARQQKAQQQQQQAEQQGGPGSQGQPGQTGTPAGQPKLKNFSYYLLIKCQRDFERDKSTEMYREEKLKEIEKAETEEEKTKLKNNLNEEINKYKWRTLGSIRFVGELYKRGLLTKFLAHICVSQLLERIRKTGDEESVECLCKLLTTIGKKMEDDKSTSHVQAKRVPPDAVQQYLESLQAILNEQKISKRMQFAIRDLIELKSCNWIPRRKEAGPMKIDEVHSAARLEEITKKVELDQMESKKQIGGGGSMSQTRGGPQPGRIPQRGSTGSNLGYGGGGGGLDYDDDSLAGGPVGGRQAKRGSQRDQGRQKDRSRQGNVPAQPSHQDQRSILPGSLSKHLHAAGTEITLGPQRGSYRSKPGSSGGGSTTQIANRYAGLATDDDLRRRDSAPSSRDSSQSRMSAMTSSSADRQAALDAVVGLVRSSSSSVGAGAVSGPSSSFSGSAGAGSRPPRVTFQGGPLGGAPASSREQSLTRNRDDRNDMETATPGDNQRTTASSSGGPVDEKDNYTKGSGSSSSMTSLGSKGCGPGGQNFGATAPTTDPVDSKPPSGPKKPPSSSSFENNNNNNNNNSSSTSINRSTSKDGSRDPIGCLVGDESIDDQSPQRQQPPKQHPEMADQRDDDEDFDDENDDDDEDDEENGRPNRKAIDPNLIELDRFIKSMDPIDPDQLLKWIGENVSEHIRANDYFARALARSLCSKVFSSYMSESDMPSCIDQFEQCCRVFQRHVTSNSKSERRLLTVLKEFYYHIRCPRDFLASTFNILSDAQVVPRESFIEWWRLENKRNKSGMILKNNQLNQFFNTLSRDQDKTTGPVSSSKQ